MNTCSINKAAWSMFVCGHNSIIYDFMIAAFMNTWEVICTWWVNRTWLKTSTELFCRSYESYGNLQRKHSLSIDKLLEGSKTSELQNQQNQNTQSQYPLPTLSIHTSSISSSQTSPRFPINFSTVSPTSPATFSFIVTAHLIHTTKEKFHCTWPADGYE
jgi:hypothetical protein